MRKLRVKDKAVLLQMHVRMNGLSALHRYPQKVTSQLHAGSHPYQAALSASPLPRHVLSACMCATLRSVCHACFHKHTNTHTNARTRREQRWWLKPLQARQEADSQVTSGDRNSVQSGCWAGRGGLGVGQQRSHGFWQ